MEKWASSSSSSHPVWLRSARKIFWRRQPRWTRLVARDSARHRCRRGVHHAGRRSRKYPPSRCPRRQHRGWHDRVVRANCCCARSGRASEDGPRLGREFFCRRKSFSTNRRTGHRTLRETSRIRSLGLGNPSLGKKGCTQRHAEKHRSRDAGYTRPVSLSSNRAGAIPGTHEIGFNSAADTITLRHTAHSREGFARGTLQAARWIAGKKGFYEFKEILGELT